MIIGIHFYLHKEVYHVKFVNCIFIGLKMAANKNVYIKNNRKTGNSTNYEYTFWKTHLAVIG